MKRLLYIIILLVMGNTALAQSSFSITNSDNEFTITRNTNKSTTETVCFRTVSLAAVASQHFASQSGNLVFDSEHNTRTVVINEGTPGTRIYRYQIFNRSYRLELLDQDGFRLAFRDRTLNYGSDYKITSQAAAGDYDLDDTKSAAFPINGASLTVTHDGYDSNPADYAEGHKYISVASTEFYAAGTQNYLATINAQLRMTLEFLSYETMDGYQYVQILTDNTTNCDNRSGCSDGNPGNISYSRYMAAFEMNTGAIDGVSRRYTFPVTSAGNNEGATNPWGFGTTHPLSMQKFNTNCRADDGKLLLNSNFSSIVLRLNASGKDKDNWIIKDIYAKVNAVDNTAPTLQAITVSPGPYNSGNEFYVSVHFSESMIENCSLNTSWGTATYEAGTGTNVLTFKGIINAAAGTKLSVNSLSGNTHDLFQNNFGGSVNNTFNDVVSTSPTYTINYNLDGGSFAANCDYPTSYTWESDSFTLKEPGRPGYYFEGWTGSNGNVPQRTVTIDNHSHGNLSFTANWTKVTTGSGTSADPYVITTTKGLDALAQYVNAGFNCNGLYFELGANITYSHSTAWNNAASKENNYTTIGSYDNQFRGTFDGKGHTISGIRIYKGGKKDADKYHGLFGFIYNGVVKGLTLSDTRITGYREIGGIAGQITLGTIEDCTIASNVCIHAALIDSFYFGGVTGYNQGTIQRCIISASLTVADETDCEDFGSIVGVNTSGGAIYNCIVIGSTVPAVYQSRSGAITGSHYGTVKRNYYRSCTVAGVANATGVGVAYQSSNHDPHDIATNQGAMALYSITLPEGVTLVRSASATLPGTGNATYTTGADINGVPYSFDGGTITLSYSGSMTPVFSVNGSPIVGNSFTMPAEDVTVTVQALGMSLSQGAKDGVNAKWSTFYDGSKNYTLTGGEAYTMGTDHMLYRLGTNGQTIPKGTAVVIIATSAETYIVPAGTETLSITDNAPGGNQLHGSDSAVDVSGLSGDPYVLSRVEGVIGFRLFTGAAIPAGKAYYVE